MEDSIKQNPVALAHHNAIRSAANLSFMQAHYAYVSFCKGDWTRAVYLQTLVEMHITSLQKNMKGHSLEIDGVLWIDPEFSVVEEVTLIPKWKQRRIIRDLETDGIIHIRTKGTGNKVFFIVDSVRIADILNDWNARLCALPRLPYDGKEQKAKDSLERSVPNSLERIVPNGLERSVPNSLERSVPNSFMNDLNILDAVFSTESERSVYTLVSDSINNMKVLTKERPKRKNGKRVRTSTSGSSMPTGREKTPLSIMRPPNADEVEFMVRYILMYQSAFNGQSFRESAIHEALATMQYLAVYPGHTMRAGIDYTVEHFERALHDDFWKDEPKIRFTKTMLTMSESNGLLKIENMVDSANKTLKGVSPYTPKEESPEKASNPADMIYVDMDTVVHKDDYEFKPGEFVANGILFNFKYVTAGRHVLGPRIMAHTHENVLQTYSPKTPDIEHVIEKESRTFEALMVEKFGEDFHKHPDYIAMTFEESRTGRRRAPVFEGFITGAKF